MHPLNGCIFIFLFMKDEISNIAGQLQDAYNGDPWFGKSITSLLAEVDESVVFEKPGGQHSILELLWHMVIWREFTISRLQPSDKLLNYFEENDWRVLDHSNKALWQEGLQQLDQTQNHLLEILRLQNDSLLEKIVSERSYNFKKLLFGIIQHDIYHLGQIAYLNKLLTKK